MAIYLPAVHSLHRGELITVTLLQSYESVVLLGLYRCILVIMLDYHMARLGKGSNVISQSSFLQNEPITQPRTQHQGQVASRPLQATNSEEPEICALYHSWAQKQLSHSTNHTKLAEQVDLGLEKSSSVKMP